MRFYLCLVLKGQMEQVQLLAPSVVLKNRPVNLTAVLRPSAVGTVTYYWWLANKTEVNFCHLVFLIVDQQGGRPVRHSLSLSLSHPNCTPQPVVTLDGTLSFTFSKEGKHGVTLQASVGTTVLQDQMAVQVYGEFRTVLVSNLLLALIKLLFY